jgi:hypothetical protein
MGAVVGGDATGVGVGGVTRDGADTGLETGGVWTGGEVTGGGTTGGWAGAAHPTTNEAVPADCCLTIHDAPEEES